MLLVVSFSSIEEFLNEVLLEKFHVSRQTVRGERLGGEWEGSKPTYLSTVTMSAIVGDQLFTAQQTFNSDLPGGGGLNGFVEQFDGFVKRIQEAGLQFRAGNFTPFVKGVQV